MTRSALVSVSAECFSCSRVSPFLARISHRDKPDDDRVVRQPDAKRLCEEARGNMVQRVGHRVDRKRFGRSGVSPGSLVCQHVVRANLAPASWGWHQVCDQVREARDAHLVARQGWRIMSIVASCSVTVHRNYLNGRWLARLLLFEALRVTALAFCSLGLPFWGFAKRLASVLQHLSRFCEVKESRKVFSSMGENWLESQAGSLPAP